jgi:hypothetical protein
LPTATHGQIRLRCYGLASGHTRRRLFPLRPRDIWRDANLALRFRPTHSGPEYNAVQRLVYVLVGCGIALAIVSGLAIWKPGQLLGNLRPRRLRYRATRPAPSLTERQGVHPWSCWLSGELAAVVEQAIECANSTAGDERFRVETKREVAERRAVVDRGREYERLARLRSWLL